MIYLYMYMHIYIYIYIYVYMQKLLSAITAPRELTDVVYLSTPSHE